MDIVAAFQAREEAARVCFIEHDVDGNGTIDAAELASVLLALGLKSADDSEEAFTGWDECLL